MPLAKNLNSKNFRPKIKLPKPKKWMIWVVLAVAIFIGIFGAINLTKVLRPTEKQVVKYETGDRPLQQQVMLWVTADGGLFLRETADPKGKILIVIPNGTSLQAQEIKDDWYQITYMGKTGWVNKNYVTTQAPAEDPTKNWNTYANKGYNYSLRFPKDWVIQDYGANPASGSVSYVAFGPQLSQTLDPSKLPPVIVRITSQTKDAVEAAYKSNQNATPEAATISAIAGTKITYNSPSGIQMTAFVVAKGSNTYIIEETGGYSDELSKIVASLNLG